MPFDAISGALEDNIITLLISHPIAAPQIALQVSADLYSTPQYRRIAQAAMDWLTKYGQPVGFAHIKDCFERELSRPTDEGILLAKTFLGMEELSEDIQHEAVLTQLQYFIRKREVYQTLSAATDLLAADKLDEALEEIFKTRTKISAVNRGVWLHDDEWFSFLNREEIRGFSSGIGALDEGNLYVRRGWLLLFIAATGMGKSWYLIQAGKEALFQGHKVLHISLENDLEQCQLRWTQSMLGLTADQASAQHITMIRYDAQKKVLGFDTNTITTEGLANLSRSRLTEDLKPWRRRGQLRVDWFPSGSLTLSGLNAHLEYLSRAENFRPDVVLIDYADQMQIDAENLRVATGRLIIGLRGLAGMRNFACFTASQGNRSSIDAKLVTKTMVAEDISKTHTADIVLTYSQTKDEYDRRVARILVAKARSAKDRWIAVVTQNYETGQFVLDSAYFSAPTAAELKRYTNPEDPDED